METISAVTCVTFFWGSLNMSLMLKFLYIGPQNNCMTYLIRKVVLGLSSVYLNVKLLTFTCKTLTKSAIVGGNVGDYKSVL